MPDEKHYHKEPTGLAAETAKVHGTEHELKLFGSCFCPFVHVKDANPEISYKACFGNLLIAIYVM